MLGPGRWVKAEQNQQQIQGAVCFGINSHNSTWLIVARLAVREAAAHTPRESNQLAACLPHPLAHVTPLPPPTGGSCNHSAE